MSVKADSESEPQEIVYVAAKTWLDSPDGGGWCLTMLKYDYETGAAIGSPYRYPAEPSATNYFVPTAMTAFQSSNDATAAETWIIVTGHSPGTNYGNSDYHTVCFSGNLTVRWVKTYSRPQTFGEVGFIDEYPVGIDWSVGINYTVDPPIETVIAGVTGNTWNGVDWDIQTVLHDVFDGGDFLGVMTEATSGNLDDVATGIRMFGEGIGENENSIIYVVGTAGVGTGNTIAAYRYTGDESAPGSWVKATRSLSYTDKALKANAMHADYVFGTSGDFAFAAGQIADSTQSHMLLAKFDFYGGTQNHTYGEAGYVTSFSYNGGGSSPRAGEALCIDHFHASGTGTLIALGGYSYRDSSHGNDSCVVLFNEFSGQPELRWSAWTKQEPTTPYNVADVCMAVGIAGKRQGGGSTLDDFFIHCAAQVPKSATDLDWRGVVYRSTVSSNPSNPGSKSSSGAPVDVEGFPSGGDIPRHLELNPASLTGGDTTHNFIVVGDVWNGSTYGFDILTRRFNFTEPE